MCKWYAFILNTDIRGITFIDPRGQCDMQATSVGEVARFNSDGIVGGLVVAVVVAVTLGVILVYLRWRRRYVYFNIKHYYKYVHNLSVYNSHCTLHYIIRKFIILNLLRYYITLKICILFFSRYASSQPSLPVPLRHPPP